MSKIIKEDIKEKISGYKIKLWGSHWAWVVLLTLPIGLLYWIWPGARSVILVAYGVWIIVKLIRYSIVRQKFKSDFKKAEALVYEGTIIDSKIITTRYLFREIPQLQATLQLDNRTKDFILWDNRHNPFLEEDASLRYRLNELKGLQLRVTLFPKSGCVLSYELITQEGVAMENIGHYQLTVTVSRIWAQDPQQVSRHLNKEKIDYVHFKRTSENSFFFLELSSDTEEDILEIPSYLPGFSDLDNWLQSLPDFDWDHYQNLKTDVKETKRFLLWEKVYKAGVPKSSIYAGMLFYKEGKELGVVCDNGTNSKINEGDIEMITVKSYVNTHRDADYQIDLMGFDASMCSVKSRAENFDELLSFIFQLPAFDGQKFKKYLSTLSDMPQVIWQAKPKANSAIQPGNFDKDYWESLEKGIYIENMRTLVPWQDFKALEQTGLATKRSVPSPNPDYHNFQYTIEKPVIFNGLHLEKLVFDTPAIKLSEKLNTGWPIENISASICFGETGIKNYETLKKYFTPLLGDPHLNESQHYLEAHWKKGQTQISIQAWKPHQIDVFYNYCRLSLIHEPDVTHFFEDDYSLNFQLNENISYKIFGVPFSIKPDYKDIRFVRIMPDALATRLVNENQCLVWMDKQSRIVGIGNRNFAHIQSLRQQKGWLFSGYFWRDSPVELNLHYYEHEGNLYPNFEFYMGKFDLPNEQEWKNLIDEITGFVPFSCHYMEDRQYY